MGEFRVAIAQAGFNSVFLGIETPSAEALRETGKRVNISGMGAAAAGSE